MATMYDPMVNSPVTTLAGDIDATQTTITIANGAVLPAAPNIATIGLGEDAETILYGVKSGNLLQSVTRGFQGTAKIWTTGTKISRNFTAADHSSFKENIETLESAQGDLASLITTEKTNLVGAINEVENAIMSLGDWDFGLITGVPESFEDFGSIV